MSQLQVNGTSSTVKARRRRPASRLLCLCTRLTSHSVVTPELWHISEKGRLKTCEETRKNCKKWRGARKKEDGEKRRNGKEKKHGEEKKEEEEGWRRKESKRERDYQT